MNLIGYVGGVEVSFDFTPPDLFTACIPKRLDGIYIVELHAVDDAGNINSYTNIFVKINFQNLSIEILPDNYPFKIEKETKNIESLDTPFNTKEIPNHLYTQMIPINYTYRELIV